MTASAYTRTNINNTIHRAIAYPVPTRVYVSLHTANPGLTGASEVLTGAWPAYVRQDVAKGGAQSSGWDADTAGVSHNSLQLVSTVHNGASPLNISHWSLWDAITGGNCLESGSFDTVRTLNPGDVYVIDVGKLTSQVV